MSSDSQRAPYNEAAQPAIAHLAEAMAVGDAGQTIYDQEARGQQSFVDSTTLPTEMSAQVRATLEGLGTKFLGVVEGDDMFQYVELPEGWTKQPTDHSMWSDLVDDRGRKRGAIFYKAAFYDRSAHMYLSTRFSFRFDYDKEKSEQVAVANVFDGAVIIHTTEPIALPEERTDKFYKAIDATEKAAKKWLDKNYPRWHDAAAYWD